MLSWFEILFLFNDKNINMIFDKLLAFRKFLEYKTLMSKNVMFGSFATLRISKESLW